MVATQQLKLLASSCVITYHGWDGLMVIVLVFYSNHPSSNPSEGNSFSVKCCLCRKKWQMLTHFKIQDGLKFHLFICQGTTIIAQLSFFNCKWTTVSGQLSLDNCKWTTASRQRVVWRQWIAPSLDRLEGKSEEEELIFGCWLLGTISPRGGKHFWANNLVLIHFSFEMLRDCAQCDQIME